jgi:hypothetical protein
MNLRNGLASLLRPEDSVQHAGGSGIAFLREQQLLNTPGPKSAR